MRRYDVRDITDQHYRALRLLLATNQAEAHIVVSSKRPWPPTLSYSRHQPATVITGEAIN